MPWLVGFLEVLLIMAVVIWMLTIPSIFRAYYRAMGVSANFGDSGTVVQWMKSAQRERSLNLALTHGNFTPKELRHYSDVRRLLQWLPRVTGALALLLVITIVASQPTWSMVASAQSRGLILWAVGAGLLTAVAIWDWKLLFAAFHQPFFGDRSWRVGRESYSLVLFPTWFWKVTGAVVLLAPVLVLSGVALWIKANTKPSSRLPDLRSET